MRIPVVVARVAVALAIVAAIVAQLHSSIAFAGKDGTTDTGNVLINFFSYFTIDSNALSIVLLGVGAVLLWRRADPEPRGYTVTRLAVVTYMVLTGVVYNTLLRGQIPQGATVAWSNEILHVIAPLYLAIDWFVAPGRNALRPSDALRALAFPVVWIIYTLLRGPFAADPYQHTDYWYPYPFINPVTSAGGYGTVAAYVVGISVVVIALAFGLSWTSRRWAAPAA